MSTMTTVAATEPETRETAATAPTRRDGHLQHIAEHGRMSWQNASGYNKRARVERAIDAVRARATVGEISETLAANWGLYRPRL